MLLMEPTTTTPAVLNLEAFGMTSLAELAALGPTAVTVKIGFIGPSVADMRTLTPAERRTICGRRVAEAVGSLKASLMFKKVLKERIQPVGGWISAILEADRLPLLLLYPNIESIRVESVKGVTAIRAAQAKPPVTLWYAVHERLALVPVEGEPAALDRFTKERIVMIEGASLQEVVEKAFAEAATHGQPFFNGDCELVRWELEEISEIFASLDIGRALNSNGTEIYAQVSSQPIDPFDDESFLPDDE